MVDRVKKVLEDSFQGIEIDIEQLDNGRIAGSAVWYGFADLDHLDRQNKIRDVLRRELGAEATQVGVLLTYTPDELRAMKAA